MVQAADDYKSFGVRIRALYVKPTESTDGTLSALNTSVTDAVAPEVDFEYFFTKNFSAELIAAFTHHDIKTVNGYQGSTWLLPPNAHS